MSADGACVAAGAQPLRLQLLHLQPSMLRRKHLVRCLRLHGGVKEATSQRPCQPPAKAGCKQRSHYKFATSSMRWRGPMSWSSSKLGSLGLFCYASGGVAEVSDGAVSA